MARGKRKRSKAIAVLLLPAIIFLWIVGWSLYLIGHQKEQGKNKPSHAEEEDHVHLTSILLEELPETEN